MLCSRAALRVLKSEAAASILTLLSLLVNGFQTIRYVDVNSASPEAPYTNWAAAATIIQDAVDASAAAEEFVVRSGWR